MLRGSLNGYGKSNGSGGLWASEYLVRVTWRMDDQLVNVWGSAKRENAVLNVFSILAFHIGGREFTSRHPRQMNMSATVIPRS